MKIKKAEELLNVHADSQTDLILWLSKKPTKEKSFWDRCYKILSESGTFRVICEPEDLGVVCDALQEAGFLGISLNIWAFSGEAPEPHRIENWESWGPWFSPSWRPILCVHKKEAPFEKASLLSFYQKPLSEKTLVSNLLRWGTGLLKIFREDGSLWRDVVLVHAEECTDQCVPQCPIYNMDVNRGTKPSSEFFQVEKDEFKFLELIKEKTTPVGGECFESYMIEEEDLSSFSDSSYRTILAQGDPGSVSSEIFRVLSPGGLYVRISSSLDPIGALEDTHLIQAGFRPRGKMALAFESGVCFYTASSKGFTSLVKQISFTRETAILGKIEIKPVRKRSGSLQAMFGSDE